MFGFLGLWLSRLVPLSAAQQHTGYHLTTAQQATHFSPHTALQVAIMGRGPLERARLVLTALLIGVCGAYGKPHRYVRVQ